MLSSTSIGGGGGFKVAGVGDFNGDGKTDILWQSPNGGDVLLWAMNGNQVLSSTDIGGSNGWDYACTDDQCCHQRCSSDRRLGCYPRPG